MNLKKPIYHQLKQIKIGLIIFLCVVVVGTFGYNFLEGWNFLESFYMTIITISTTGFKEVHELSDAGRLFTLFILVSGVGSIAFIGGRTIQMVFETRILRRRRMSKKIEQLKNHYVICGYGRMGKAIARILEIEKQNFVVIENEKTNNEILQSQGILFVDGDGTHDEDLLKAGIERAKGFVAVLPNDPDNVFATLSAKALNPKIFVVARAIYDASESKLLKAGADRVVKPYDLGGERMAHLLIRPSVIDFMDVVSSSINLDLNIEEVQIHSSSKIKNKKLNELPQRDEMNIIVVSVIKPDGKFIYNPKSTVTISENDRLYVLGDKISLSKFNSLCS